jgi:tRNA U55 pseudouridine synthase TruB
VSVQGAVSIPTKPTASTSFSEYPLTDIKIIDFYIESLYMTKSYINYTGDALGLIQKMSAVDLDCADVGAIIKKYNNYSYEQEYPMYSSYEIRVGGLKKPLWYFAKNGIPIDKIPTHQITVHQLEPTGEPTIITSATYFIEQVARINEEKSRLRKDEVIAQYHALGPISLISIPFIAKVSGGAYIRRLCEDIGAEYGIPAMADSIERIAYHFPQ